MLHGQALVEERQGQNMQVIDDRSVNINKKLLEAAENGEKDIIHSLINSGADVNYYNEKTKQSVIDLAWENAHYDSMLMLLEADSNFPQDFTLDSLYQDDDIPETLKKFIKAREELHGWIKNNELEKVEEYVSTHRVSKLLNSKNQSAIEIAAKHASVDILAVLFNLQLPLQSEKIILPDNKAALLELVDNSGNTPLLTAAKIGKKDNVDFFTRCGADVNYYNEKIKQSAIDLAWENKHYDSVLLLLKADANFPQEFALTNT